MEKMNKKCKAWKSQKNWKTNLERHSGLPVWFRWNQTPQIWLFLKAFGFEYLVWFWFFFCSFSHCLVLFFFVWFFSKYLVLLHEISKNWSHEEKNHENAIFPQFSLKNVFGFSWFFFGGVWLFLGKIVWQPWRHLLCYFVNFVVYRNRMLNNNT